jgi:hypothetical protein
VLTHDVVLEGFTHAQWTRLAEAFRPRPFVPREHSERVQEDVIAENVSVPAGGVVAVTSGSVLRKLVSTRTGRIDVREQPWPEALESLAARHGARWAAEISAGALDELADRFGERLAPGQDFLGQALIMLAVLRELEAERVITFWPFRTAEWPIPSERAVGRALDLLCPDGKALVIGVFEAGTLSTCLVARRCGSGFDRLVGPDELAGEMGLLSGDFRRDHRHLAAAVERRIGKIAVGCYGELGTFQALAGTREPGAWARAVAAQDVVISPSTSCATWPRASVRGIGSRAKGRSGWRSPPWNAHPGWGTTCASSWASIRGNCSCDCSSAIEATDTWLAASAFGGASRWQSCSRR